MEDKKTAQLGPKTTRVHPKQRANFITNICFCWAVPIFVKGYKKNLTEHDLYGALPSHESSYLGDRLEQAWLKEENKCTNPSLWKALIRVFGKEFAMYGLLLAICEFGLKMPQPIFLSKLMEYYSPNQTTVSKDMAYMYASGIVFLTLLHVLVAHSYIFGLMHLGMKIRVASCSLIYRKALRLSKSALVDTTVGQMVNLLSNDVNRFDMAVTHMHNLWVTPIETVVVMYLLYTSLGPSSLIGIGFLLLFIPVQMYLAKRTSVHRLRTALRTDRRVRLMNEIVSGIQVIKMYTWEKSFAKLVDVARKLEIEQIKMTSYIRAMNICFTIFMNRVAIFLCVLTYVLTGNILQSQYVYVVSSFYGMLKQSVTMFFPQGVTLLSETMVSVQRVKKFLLSDEIDRNRVLHNRRLYQDKKNGIVLKLEDIEMNSVGINMEGVCVKWDLKSPTYTLSNISINVKQNELVAIIGAVGSGKTTLLHVLLKELSLLKGSLNVGGAISYASQEPWIFAGSVRQNILFGQDMDRKRYKQVIKVCALERDFSLFPYGDRTLVGERGAMLSGGQKARINLARAIYKDADIFLLDDPLSAVDTHVGKQLYDECIVGFLREKCVVLVTHQLQYLRTVDNIYLLENGNIAMSGTYNDLKNANNEFLKLLESEPEKEDEIETTGDQKLTSFKSLEQIDEVPVENKEQISSGTISKRIYMSYLNAGGNVCSIAMLFLLFVLCQVGASGVDYFLAFWVNLEQKRFENKIEDSFEDTFFTSKNCLYTYSTLVAFVVFVTITRSMNFFRFCMKASRNLHNRMFLRIVFTSMRFFNVTSSGRILNRFSKDMGSIDEVLPVAIIDTIQIGMIALSINIVVAVVNPWILIPSVVILVLFYILRTIYLSTSRDLKRIEGTTRSPVFTHMTASLQGMTTIRAFGAQDMQIMEFDQHQDLHSSAFYMFLGCTRSFGFWLDMHCVIYIGLVTISFLALGTETYGGNVGLGITQAIALTGMLQWGMRQWSELENQMTSVERVVEYTEVLPEQENETKTSPKWWPNAGNLEFKAVSMRYAPEEQLVLKKLSFTIASTEKVGIVGRTGAGKSSLMSALFRLVPIEGAIVIDGIDITKMSLQSLRSKISIIPQEPVLFSGTLRKNLDPFDEYDDNALWDALEEVELKSGISEVPSGLHASISEGGSNFSVGQRQLLCLARAIVRNNRILVLDEATANVDPQTDELIQATIRKKFESCTVLTIAHRLHTVMDADKILVMDAGEVAEFDHPYVLLQNQDSIFYGLVKQTGKGMADNLIKLAQKNYLQKTQGKYDEL